MRKTRLIALLSGAVAIGASACGGDPSPKPAPITESSLSASPSASGAPTMPAEAKGTDEAAAKAFVIHFIRALDYAGPSGDTAALSKLAAPSCGGCVSLTDFIDRVYRDGGAIRGSGWHKVSLETGTPRAGRIVVRTVVRVAPQTVVEKAGASPKSYAGADRVLKIFTLQSRSGTWRVVQIEEQQ